MSIGINLNLDPFTPPERLHVEFRWLRDEVLRKLLSDKQLFPTLEYIRAYAKAEDARYLQALGLANGEQIEYFESTLVNCREIWYSIVNKP